MSKRTDNIVIQAPPATVTFSGGTHKITVTMPLAHMVRGFVLAIRRYEAAVTAELAADVHIALFEAFAWFDSLDERSKLAGTDELRALRFVRQRTHHQYAAATYQDTAIRGWRWYELALLPLGDPSHKHRKQNEIGERLYRQVLEGRPVIDTLRRVEAEVQKLAPDADLS